MMKIFKDYNGRDVSLEQVCAFMEKDHDYNVYVGTDSQVHRKKRKVLYVTCIVLHKEGKGGRIFLRKEWDRTPGSLRERLSKEVWMSLETCFALNEILPSNAEIVVDVDLNKKPQYKSSDYVHELVGMVTGQGYRCRTKPHSWAAMCVADRYSK